MTRTQKRRRNKKIKEAILVTFYTAFTISIATILVVAAMIGASL